MFIFVGCSGGASSSMFCQRIVKEINCHDENMTASFTSVDQLFQQARAYGSNYDLVFAYGAIDSLRAYNAFDYGSLFDVVFVAPQSSYLTDQIKSHLRDYATLVETLPRKLFGLMDGERSYAILREQLIELDLWRAYQSQQLAMTKSSDKDLEIFVAGADRQELYWQEMFNYLAELGIRTVQEKYSLPQLYDFKMSQDFEIRFIFGHMSMLSERDFAQVARRIDAFLVSPSSIAALKERLPWLQDYHLPYQRFDNSQTKKIIQNGAFENEKVQLLDFLAGLEFESARTTEVSVERFEEKPLPERKKFWFFTWETNKP